VVRILGDTTQRWPDRVNGPWQVEFRFALVSGREVVTSLEVSPVDGEPLELTRATLNAMPWRKFVAMARRRRREHDLLIARLLPRVSERRSAVEDVTKRYRNDGKRGRPGLSDEYLRTVASVARSAAAEHRPIYASIEAECFVSKNTAKKHLQRTRQRGFYP